MSTLPLESLEQTFHPAMSHPLQWQPVRYEIDLNRSTGLPDSVVIEFQSADGRRKKLKFWQPRFDQFGPLQISTAQSLYVADLASLGWESGQHIEVGEWEEERSTLFRASSVEEVA